MTAETTLEQDVHHGHRGDRANCPDLSRNPDELTATYAPLARSIARRIHDTLPSSSVHEFDDLLQAGLLGLLIAARNYRADRGIVFPVYARHRIRGEILDSLRRLDIAPRRLRQRQKALQKAAIRPVVQAGHTGIGEEATDAPDPALSEIQELAKDLHAVYQLTHGSGSVDPEVAQALEVQGSDQPSPDRLVENDQVRNILQRALQGLPARERAIIGLYYFHGKNMKEISQRLGLHTSRVFQLRRRALEDLGARLRVGGIQSPMDVGIHSMSWGRGHDSQSS
jgi:RNA polymerase sigma factor for flagellar operon FliA